MVVQVSGENNAMVKKMNICPAAAVKFKSTIARGSECGMVMLECLTGCVSNVFPPRNILDIHLFVACIGILCQNEDLGDFFVMGCFEFGKPMASNLHPLTN
mmetsp:Transcript_484/g.828  ORF Transcript_484/g.828 Transcript_484/m.828 type:complete len:101 (-) Transcript_484:862-1164(-)